MGSGGFSGVSGTAATAFAEPSGDVPVGRTTSVPGRTTPVPGRTTPVPGRTTSSADDEPPLWPSSVSGSATDPSSHRGGCRRPASSVGETNGWPGPRRPKELTRLAEREASRQPDPGSETTHGATGADRVN